MKSLQGYNRLCLDAGGMQALSQLILLGGGLIGAGGPGGLLDQVGLANCLSLVNNLLVSMKTPSRNIMLGWKENSL